MIATRCNTMAEMEGTPGAFCFEANDAGLFYNCPCGCETQGFIPFAGKVTGHKHSWNWDGNKDQPTLLPSIQRTTGCKWHGHLKVGIWSTV